MPELRGYQESAVRFLQGQGRGLFLDMGMGKTAIVLRALEPRHLPALVIGPKRVCEEVWPQERDIWRADLSSVLAAGSPSQRIEALESRSDLTIISRDNIKDLLAVNRAWSTVVIDELSGFKSSTSTRFKTARKILAKQVWGLTGTPSPNGYLDLWAQIYLLDKGKRLGKSIAGYRERFFKPGKRIMGPRGPVVVDWELRPGAEVKIQSLIEDLVISMQSEQDEPIINPVPVVLPRAVKDKYRELAKELVVKLDILGDVSAANRAVLTNKLTQITAGFLFSDDGNGELEWLHDVKMDALREIVDGTGSPILVFYHYQPELARLRKRFPQAETIDAPNAVKRWNAGKIPIMLAHPASAGHGLNLQYGGHTIVWTTSTWSLELWRQANRRLARPGQKNAVMVHVLSAKGTVDELQSLSLAGKLVVENSLLEFLRSPI